MELNQYDTELKDVVMEAFGHETILTRAQLLDLFDNDETFAAPIVQALIIDKRVAEVNRRGTGLLPEAITKSAAESKVAILQQRPALLWKERALWFLAGIILTLLMVWLVQKTGHHHTSHQ